MSDYYLGIDIGASSGRHILSWLEEGKLKMEEVYRFKNFMDDSYNEATWDVDRLFEEIINGLKKCKEIGKIPKCVGIDTWGVDFVLLDEKDKRIGNAVCYRDKRTNGMDKEVYKYISEDDLYKRTGIQKQLFNTIYQLMALKVRKPGELNKADSMLMMPDYFNFLLSGVKKQEYTNATTGQLVNPDTKDWDYELIKLLGYPEKIFKEIVTPGTFIGNFKEDIKKEVGFSSKVIAVASHDTASAVVSVPSLTDKHVYISSGTWSLMGTVLDNANCSSIAKKGNFTNEGGFNYKFRFLKNIMGLWMIQSVRNEIAPNLSFDEICKRAEECDIDSLVDANDQRFLAPKSMTLEVTDACKESGQREPEDIYELARVIYRSLAKCYADTIKEIEEITGVTYDAINIVGGGSNADFLNKLTKEETGKDVYAGPTEATAIGNIVVSMISQGDIKDIMEAKKLIFDSFEIKKIGE
ncbi:MAG: rhamnulokinase [Lachnospiraceae bacterium]|nr:rhamnulokinase [Lachnospiraceae bacterium]